MAAIIGDFIPDFSRFHDIIVNQSSPQNQRQQQRKPSSLRPRSHSRSQPQNSPPRRSSSRPRAAAISAQSSLQRDDDFENLRGDSRYFPGATERPFSGETRQSETDTNNIAADDEAQAPARFLSPSSSSPQVAGSASPADDAKSASMASQNGEVVPSTHQLLRNDVSSMNTKVYQQQPSPPPSQGQISHLPDWSLAPSSLSHDESHSTQQTSQESRLTVVHVRDLAHMQSLADAKMLGSNNSTSLDSGTQIKYEISGMPIADIIEMVAALLTKITTTNDRQHDAMQRNVAHQQQANQSTDSSSYMSPLSHSVLAFHGKNVPAITILSYLSRIHKYCPTTYEVFLSLLVYFDRMTERVNVIIMRSEQVRSRHASQVQPAFSSASQRDATMHDNPRVPDEMDSDLADDDDAMVESPTAAARQDDDGRVVLGLEDQSPTPNPATYFVVDSFNIHRLIIAGVTCASKFFSDVFYTNSRYAKVGGLPLAELNHLEIQFLILNDFRLAIPVEDLEAYATMLVEFYAREVMSQKSGSTA